jgi:hypothetical protein
MEAGSEISGNNAAGGSGGGVFVYRSAAFTMDGGEIYSNNYNLHGGNGGGVYVDNNAAFTMTGGEIYGHTLISNNNWNSVQYGGGVYVHNMGTFNKTGGIIYGYSEDEPKSNKIRGLYTSGYIINGNGHAVYAGAAKRRETTAGPELNLDSTKTGQAGGWEQ